MKSSAVCCYCYTGS